MRSKNVYTINCNGRLLSTERPLVMGILNVTPDSMFDGGKYFDLADNIRNRANQILSEGADIIDLGAYSTRPGADFVSPDEEMRRLAGALDVIRRDHPDAVISVDTFRGSVARRCVSDYKVDIINDISAFEMDDDMFQAVVDLRVPYILTHIKGEPQTMQLSPHYEGRVTREVIRTLSQKLNLLTSNGVSDIIIDPGFGFGKTVDDNYQLMSDLQEFQTLRHPVLVGISRKSMIYKVTGGTPQSSLTGTSVLNALALIGGADILRVHDVRPCVEVCQVVSKFLDNRL